MQATQDFTNRPNKGKQTPPNIDRIQYYLGIVANAQRPLRQLESALETAFDYAIAPEIIGNLIERCAEAGTLDYIGVDPESAGDLAMLLTWLPLETEGVQDA